ncbi:hypothetical protein MB901379_02764 [Mycobacterium basiliense]|uniref:Uncharacterized protein n=1 Tax=Mycobacterium basiliense TaxID=2094119 RepID=A0A3S4FNL6_9MYCO|nr:hypothetical protein [Mycobacterium basiliense]VDM89195.1 hypothetical protein MB901379_02764 [Mycobacterium basiliense]
MTRQASTATRLVFVYNVDATPLGMLRDVYSAITTGTTDCHLCDLTYSGLIKDKSWRRFVTNLGLDVDFQLRSTFRAAHPDLDIDCPAAFLETTGGELTQLLASADINAAVDVTQLKGIVSNALQRSGLCT